MFQKKWIILITILNLVLFSFSVYAMSGWLIKINGKTVVSIKRFEKEFETIIDFQALNNPFVSESEVNDAKRDKDEKKKYLKNLINEYLVLTDAKNQELYSDSELKEKVKILSKVFKRKFIQNIYMKKIIKKKVKAPSESHISQIMDKLNEDKQRKKWSLPEKRKYAEKLAYYEELQKALIFTITDLRSKYRVKTNDEYEDSLEK